MQGGKGGFSGEEVCGLPEHIEVELALAGQRREGDPRVALRELGQQVLQQGLQPGIQGKARQGRAGQGGQGGQVEWVGVGVQATGSSNRLCASGSPQSPPPAHTPGSAAPQTSPAAARSFPRPSPRGSRTSRAPPQTGCPPRRRPAPSASCGSSRSSGCSWAGRRSAGAAS